MGVFVLGMHRSGTSATARALHALGLNLGSDDGLIAGGYANPAGFFERTSLTSANHALLRGAKGHLLAPPESPIVIDPNGRLELAKLFHSELPGNDWAWKDPVCALTLHLWLEIIDAHNPVAVVPLRHPATIVQSLQRRGDPVTAPLGYEIWEAYTQSIASQAQALPCYIFRYERLISAPEDVLGEMSEFLTAKGYDAHNVTAAVPTVDPSLNRTGITSPSVEAMSLSQLSLWEGMLDLVGPHERLDRSQLPSPPAAYPLISLARPILFQWDKDVHDLRSQLLRTGDVLSQHVAELDSTRLANHRLAADLDRHVEEVVRLRHQNSDLAEQLATHVEMVNQLRSEVLRHGDDLNGGL